MGRLALLQVPPACGATPETSCYVTLEPVAIRDLLEAVAPAVVFFIIVVVVVSGMLVGWIVGGGSS